MATPFPTRRAGTSNVPKASFDYEVSADGIVQITDLNNGYSVTSDIENVLAQVALSEGRDSLSGLRVIYRDTLLRWDGVLLNEAGEFENFYGIGATDQAAAVAHVRASMAAANE
jgi:hypothetical protein